MDSLRGEVFEPSKGIIKKARIKDFDKTSIFAL
jgi:hypothetical protein